VIRTRMIKGQTVFYESATGVNFTSIKSVSFQGYPDLLVTVVYKDGVPHVFLPFREGNPLVSLQTAIERMDLIITKVA